jgi:hypothetical protein
MREYNCSVLRLLRERKYVASRDGSGGRRGASSLMKGGRVNPGFYSHLRRVGKSTHFTMRGNT